MTEDEPAPENAKEALMQGVERRKKLNLEDLIDEKHLRFVWRKHIKPKVLNNSLRELYLAQDPVQFAGYEWNLGSFLSSLRQDLLRNDYAPERPEIVRAAKGRGLTRPLAFLAPRDALLYRALVSHVANDLSRESRVWTQSGRQDQMPKSEGAGPTNADYVDWFATWLSKQGRIKYIAENRSHIVEIDVANFFASIDIGVVREHLLSNGSRLSKELVRLCTHILQTASLNGSYEALGTIGIPQEPFDASRTIAHSLLFEVDRLLDSHGEADCYERYMDDMVVGVRSEHEGYAVISQVQLGLERLGLHPNSSKTRVVTAERFLTDYMAEENAFLDYATEELRQAEEGEFREVNELDGSVLADIVKRAEAHASIAPAERSKRWDLVLKRYYTVLRRLHNPLFMQRVEDDMRDIPNGASHFLEYVRSFQINDDTVDMLLRAAGNARPTYHDVPLLIAETLATCPNPDDADLHRTIAEKNLKTIERELGAKESDRAADRLAAAAAVVVGKFGNEGQIAELAESLWPKMTTNSQARLQTLVVIGARGFQGFSLSRNSVPGLPWASAMTLDFLDALEEGEEQAVQIVGKLIKPRRRLQPLRFIVHCRPLLLVDVLGRARTAAFREAAPKHLAQLQRNPAILRDHRCEALFARWS